MSKPFQVAITARAARDPLQLPQEIATACDELIFDPLAEHPHRLGKATT